MGLIDGYMEALLLREGEGDAVLRPFGRFGPAVLVAREQERALKRRLTWFWGVYFVLLIGVLSVQGWQAWRPLLALALLGTVGQYAVLWIFMRSLPRTDRIPPRNRRAAFERTSAATGRPLLWASLIISLLFVLTGILVLAFTGDRTGWFPVVVFGLAAVSSTVQLRATYRGNSKAPHN